MPAAKIELDLAQIQDTDIQKLESFLTQTPDLDMTKEISRGFVQKLLKAEKKLSAPIKAYTEKLLRTLEDTPAQFQ